MDSEGSNRLVLVALLMGLASLLFLVVAPLEVIPGEEAGLMVRVAVPEDLVVDLVDLAGRVVDRVVPAVPVVPVAVVQVVPDIPEEEVPVVLLRRTFLWVTGLSVRRTPCVSRLLLVISRFISCLTLRRKA